jgi:hypothetical protein
MSQERKNYLADFFRHRSETIEALSKGQMTKKAYIAENCRFLQALHDPFSPMVSIEEAMYNYQYHNMMAKGYLMDADDCDRDERFARHKQSFLDSAHLCYKDKDKATMRLLDLHGPDCVRAYYVKTESEKLQGKLFEIVIEDLEDAIYHSKSYRIKGWLEDHGRFDKGLHASVLDEYINEKY